MRIPVILLIALFAWDVSWAQENRRLTAPQLQTIGEGIVFRISETSNEQGMQPPWKEVTITNMVTFLSRPAIGDKVTIIPLDSDIPPLDLRIIKTEKKENACDESFPAGWEVELEPINLKSFFDVEVSNRRPEFPLDVVVLYPAVKVARQISKAQLTKGMLPRGVSINTVKAAIDLTGDRNPEVILIEHCCEDSIQHERQPL